MKPLQVALRKESVDRNRVSVISSVPSILSLSARRAWIEIPIRQRTAQEQPVALRKESVDRNAVDCRKVLKCTMVALRKESVDRNIINADLAIFRTKSLSARRAWIEICMLMPIYTCT